MSPAPSLLEETIGGEEDPVSREVENWKRVGIRTGIDRSTDNYNLQTGFQRLPQPLVVKTIVLLHTSCQVTVHYPSSHLLRNILYNYLRR